MTCSPMKCVLALIAALAFSVPAFADGDSAAIEVTGAKAASELTDILGGYETYQADFIQVVVNEKGNQVQETNGKLKAKRPGLFYWETSKPLSQYIVSDGKTVQVYDPDLEQVTIQKLDGRVQSTPALLLSGQVDNLDETYRVSERKLGEHTREFTLEPRSPDSLFTSLRLSFFQGELQEMRMRDSLSQLSILSFDHIRLNDTIDAGAFTLDYPDGVDVIREGS
ncbi:outer membrane lipoprotein chaperone LolA [Marinobacter koreensis]|uniref:Outer-membrane lipoprotein carrier protein n=2 Tax=Marinobacter koreensis TaxID=335974 RepID=A0ABW0RIL8_9GAMM|nr:outer membrane lipoprotein chaperone LolA [Marinobacter koreensis]MCK7548526.1 outer membrane lipoprotein chaperone LolA [Marinobacter koreensis]MDX1819146.1 outer membrane lipoprotein chaperone LolA [Marinobacter sp.]